MSRIRIRVLRFALASLAISLFVAAPSFAQSVSPEAEAAEALVRQLWYEGVPEAEARNVGAAGAARLAALLADPAERETHANALTVLSLCGEAGAKDAVLAYANTPPAGEVDRATFRAQQALPYALGNLAAGDPKILKRLEAELGAGPPGWTFRHHTGQRVAEMNRRAAATSLAMTGRPEARAMLERVAATRRDASFAAHVQEVLVLHAERAQGGAR